MGLSNPALVSLHGKHCFTLLILDIRKLCFNSLPQYEICLLFYGREPYPASRFIQCLTLEHWEEPALAEMEPEEVSQGLHCC